LAVDLSVPTYWREFERKYLGSWSTGDKNRVRFLSQAWITARNEDEAAQSLEPLREPLGFPAFTRLVDTPKSKTSDQNAEETSKPESQKSLERADRQPVSADLQSLLDHLHTWRRGQRLTKDDEPRRLVHELLSTSIPWEEERIPRQVVDSIIPDKRYVRFEDQRTKPLGLFEFFLPRDDTTLALAEALGRYAYLGKNGRSYAGIEADRRTIARWLRANRARFVALLQPAPPLTTDAPLVHAIRSLSVAAVLRRRTGLPPDSVGLLRELLAEPIDAAPPVALTAEESAIAESVQNARAAAKDFLLKEVNRPQGAGGILFIDPLPVLAHARRTLDNARIEPLPAAYTANGSHWKARYQALAASPTTDLTPLLDARRVGIKGALSRVRTALMDAGLSGEVAGELATYCTHIVALIDAQKTRVNLDSPNVNGLRQILDTRGESWESLLAGAFETAGADSPLTLLTFATETFRTAVDAVAQADGFLKALNREVTSQEKSLNADGDPVKMFDEMKTALGEITGAGQGTAGSTAGSDGGKNA
jgi:hypothetical protein